MSTVDIDKQHTECEHVWVFAERNVFFHIFICSKMCGACKFVKELK